MSEAPIEAAPPEAAKAEEGKPDQSFTQADVDRIVQERVKRAEAKFADYDDLKQKAAGAKTVEDRVAEIERQAKESEARALRAEVAITKGLTSGQAKRLIGSTREELEADADDFLKDVTERKTKNNVSPREGTNPSSDAGGDEREFVRGLFRPAE